MENKYLIWHVDGGLGKNIAASALFEDVKKTYSDRIFIFVCSYPELFLHNPFIDRVVQSNKTQYFYSDYIENKDTIIFKYNVYDHGDYINGTKHIIECWCDILNIEYKNQQPRIYFNYPQSLGSPNLNRDKPILLLQTTGGPSYTAEGNPSYPYNWSRDIPMEIAQQIVNKFNKNYHIIHLTRANSYNLIGVERIEHEFEKTRLVHLLLESKKRILIDSSLQHIAAALQLKSDVFWIGTSITNFGYDIHNNIKANPPLNEKHLIDSYNLKYSLYENIIDCPYKTLDEMFNVQEVLDKLGN